MTWRDAAAPLRNRNFAWYFASRTTDTLGSMMAGVALAFAVLGVTDSATALGQVLAAHTIPLVVLMLYGGVLADRYPRTLVIQVSNLVAAASQGTLAVLVITGRAELWMFLVLAAVNGMADAANFPAMAGMVPQLVPREQLQPANWVLSTLLLVKVAIPPKPPKKEETSALQDLREGWAFFRTTTWLWVVVLAFGFLNAIQAGAWFTLGPARAKETFGAQGWGFVLSAESVGMLLMTVVLLRVRLRRPLLVGMLGFTLFGVPLVALGARPELWLLTLVAFSAGAGVELFIMGWNLAMQENVEDDMLSRAYSYDALGSFVAMPVGQLVFGPLGEAFGLSAVLVVSGLATIAISLLTLVSRAVRTLDRPAAARRDSAGSAG